MNKHEEAFQTLLAAAATLCLIVGRSKMMKRAKKQLLPSIGTLPKELLTEVCARVGSSAVTDLFNLKQSCKQFYRVGVDIEVLRRVSLEKLPAIPWLVSSGYHSFIRQCGENGNPEALFKHGMVEYFSRLEQESGIELLKKAIDLGHEVAAYMLRLILLCTNYPLKDQALEILKKVEQGCLPSSLAKIKKCHKRSKEILRDMWTNTVSLPKPAEPI
ncbi:putative F-box protein At1g67623 [Telopea speciosissima]|uniref:putative F-box protein At1g67623 n=1 Tax=Telopea speciosissima TaxID=54955 RepID=UPI001CC5ADCB|nr:putative F-box protein At1g67623 [Telopea speciosissima]